MSEEGHDPVGYKVRLKNATKWVARALLGDYEIFLIYEHSLADPIAGGSGECEPVSEPFMELHRENPFVAEQLSYAGEGSCGFARVVEGQCVSMAWYWYGRRYETRNFWPLADREAKLVHVTTHSAHRGKGHAPRLIADSMSCLRAAGFERLYARIWHTNHPSISAFRKAGWRRVALACRVYPFGLKYSLRWVRRYNESGS